MTRRFIVTSGKGGVGKTTIVSALGVAIAELGFKVLLVDMDFGLNNLDVIMGIENKVVYDIIDVLEGKCDARQALVQDFFIPTLYTLPSIHGFCRVRFGSKELLQIISQVENNFDFVIIDCPAGIDGGFKRAVECAGEHIVVTTPHISAVRDAGKVVNCLKSNLNSLPYVIINRARGDLILDGEMLSTNSIIDFMSAELIGVVPEDDEICTQSYKGGALEEMSFAKQSINMIASNIITGEKNIFDCTKRYKGVVGRIRKALRKRV